MDSRRQSQGEAYASVRPGQDEKMEIFRKHHGLMDAAFDRAREVRKTQRFQHEDRNRQIKDKIEAIQQRTDGEAKRQQERMNEFSSEFDESLQTRRKDWTGKLGVEHAEVDRRSNSISEDLAELEHAITEEGDACRADTASETEPLKEALREHGEQLRQQVVSREERHTEFQKRLSTEMCRLRRKLAQEAETRRKRITEAFADLKERYAELGDRLQKQDESVRKWLLDLQTRVDFERTKRTTAHTQVVDSFTAFVADLEKHMLRGKKMQEGTRDALLAMQAKLRSPESP
uniref:Uncharacterized protein n=1 Tax=Alexandrium monilatum TaxID=311494 RepID=A0A7S4S3T0_9DINO